SRSDLVSNIVDLVRCNFSTVLQPGLNEMNVCFSQKEDVGINGNGKYFVVDGPLDTSSIAFGSFNVLVANTSPAPIQLKSYELIGRIINSGADTITPSCIALWHLKIIIRERRTMVNPKKFKSLPVKRRRINDEPESVNQEMPLTAMEPLMRQNTVLYPSVTGSNNDSDPDPGQQRPRAINADPPAGVYVSHMHSPGGNSIIKFLTIEWKALPLPRCSSRSKLEAVVLLETRIGFVPVSAEYCVDDSLALPPELAFIPITHKLLYVVVDIFNQLSLGDWVIVLTLNYRHILPGLPLHLSGSRNRDGDDIRSALPDDVDGMLNALSPSELHKIHDESVKRAEKAALPPGGQFNGVKDTRSVLSFLQECERTPSWDIGYSPSAAFFQGIYLERCLSDSIRQTVVDGVGKRLLQQGYTSYRKAVRRAQSIRSDLTERFLSIESRRILIDLWEKLSWDSTRETFDQFYLRFDYTRMAVDAQRRAPLTTEDVSDRLFGSFPDDVCEDILHRYGNSPSLGDLVEYGRRHNAVLVRRAARAGRLSRQTTVDVIEDDPAVTMPVDAEMNT
ncbi:hypothetical protein FOZ63_028880, partial [Perkinsus olseni]